MICLLPRPAAAKHKVINGWMVNMDFLIPILRILVSRSMVAGSGTDRNTRRRRDKQFMVCIEALLIGRVLRTTPTNRNYARLSLCVVDSGADRVQESFVALVRGKVDRNFGFRRHRARYLYIEHNLAVVCRCWSVSGMVYRNCRDGGGFASRPALFREGQIDPAHLWPPWEAVHRRLSPGASGRALLGFRLVRSLVLARTVNEGQNRMRL